MTRPLHAWLTFGISLLVLLVATGWVSLKVIQLDRSERAAREQAAVEERVRLALWRMDSALTPMVAQESLRIGSAPKPSGDAPPFVRAYFRLGPDGVLSSPREGKGKGPGENLADLGALVSADTLREAVPAEEGESPMWEFPAVVQEDAPGQQSRQQARQQGTQSAQPAQQPQSAQIALGSNDLQARVLNRDQLNTMVQSQMAELPSLRGGARPGAAIPLWIGGTLLLARREPAFGPDAIQGAWLDWPRLRTWLLGLVADLFPGADLVSAPSGSGDGGSRMLAALPLLLVPGEGPRAAAPVLTPLRISLFIAWACVLLGAGAVAALLSGVLALSERRAAFVSAVTHELRTPLTTFRMYTEMLSGGMVEDEEKRRSYLATLSREAERLSHLVGNVLAYARLERTRAGGRAEAVSLGDLLERVSGPLRDRASQAGMSLEVEASPDVLAGKVRVDVSAAEQILFNLVDNASKYASRAQDRRIHIGAERRGSRMVLRVRDHGPGVADPRRLFRPFSKSAKEAADTAPGVGLGLALSKRLARALGGDLELERGTAEGASFRLSLPRA